MSDPVLIDHLIREEGYRRSAYADHLGYLTIGIGRMIDGRLGGGITPDEAKYLLANDIKRVEDNLDVYIPWWRTLDQARRLVLTSMAFQMGVNGLLKFTNTLADVQAGRYADASVRMMQSKWAKQTPKRAARLARVMETGDLTFLRA